MTKRICAAHVVDETLKGRIRSSGEEELQCDYCGLTTATISIGALSEMFDTTIDRFFTATTGYDDEGQYEAYDTEPTGEALRDLLTRISSIDNSPLDDVVGFLIEKWFEPDTMVHQYGANPHFVENEKFDEPLSRAWEDMERSLKYQARFNNPTVLRMLEKIFGPILTDRIGGSEGVILSVGPGDPLSKLYRARPFATTELLEEAMKDPERNLGPPPPGIGRAGRMNAKGVPVFYGAVNPTVAIAEVRPPVGSYVVVAQFTIARKLRLLEVDKLVLIEETGSPFDPATYDRMTRKDFLKKLVRKLTRPVMPEHEDESYLITQAVADFIATHDNLNIDGIVFSSMQVDPDARLQLDARNVVLFNKSSDVGPPFDGGSIFSQQKTYFELWKYDDDTAMFDPVLISADVNSAIKKLKRIKWGSESLGPALSLDRHQIEIHEVEGVRVMSKATPVRHEIRSAKDS